jgi:hypothetical protein
MEELLERTKEELNEARAKCELSDRQMKAGGKLIVQLESEMRLALDTLEQVTGDSTSKISLSNDS